MTADLNKNLTSIIYNHLNQPVKILFNNSEASKIEYLYDATGGKLQKKVTDGASIATTDYIDGFHYGNGVLDFFATAEGYVKNTTISGVNHYNYLFNYTDHLGNVRLTYTLDTRDKTLKIMEENNYYPFGLKHANYNISKKEYEIAGGNPVIAPCPGGLCAQEYNYKYQGQEHQDELGLNWDSFKWRNYDPAIGRFMSIDPLAEKYSYNGVYNFSENRVIDGRELEGLEWAEFGLFEETSFSPELEGAVTSEEFGWEIGLEEVQVGTTEEPGFFESIGDAFDDIWDSLTDSDEVTPEELPEDVQEAAQDAAKDSKPNAEETKAPKENPKKAAREAGRQKREEQPASEKRAKDLGRDLEKSKGKDARRTAHDQKDPIGKDRTLKELKEDYDPNNY